MPSSIPRTNSTPFLELQMLINQKEFLEKQLINLDNRKTKILSKLEILAQDMRRIESIVNADSEEIKRSRYKKKKFGVELKTMRY